MLKNSLEEYDVNMLQTKYLEFMKESGLLKGNLLEKDRKEGNIIYLKPRVA